MPDRHGAMPLLIEILTATPRLDDTAACRTAPRLFDLHHDHETARHAEARHAEAVALCRYRCPVLDQCAAWAATIPPADRADYGVLAGTRPDRQETRR